MRQTLIEKIVENYSVGLQPGQKVYANDFVMIRPKHIMTHDNTGAVIPKFNAMGAQGVFDSTQPVFALDHNVQNTSQTNLDKYAKIQAFAAQYCIAFHPARRGIGHQIMAEEGFALPGTLVVGSDSHSNFYGALSCLGTPVVRTDAAAIWATGQTWWQVPEIVKVEITGSLARGVTGKDVILAMIGTFKKDEVLNYCLEFSGKGLANLSMSQRMTIANMTTEWGALAGVFPYDDVTRRYLMNRVLFYEKRGDEQPRITRIMVEKFDKMDLKPDQDAFYSKVITFDLGSVTPTVAGPNEVKAMHLLPHIKERHIKINKAYLLSCVNGRLDDIKDAAEVMRGKKVADGVEFYLAAASAYIEQAAIDVGYWGILLEAGAIALPPGCGPCIGLGKGLLENQEVGISATNRNFKGRMGAPSAQVYLASPAVVAASAVAGFITGPEEGEIKQIDASLKVSKREVRSSTSNQEILEGFPERLQGDLVFIPKDNMNTDGLYGNEFTYQDNLPPEFMASKALLNYDPEFQNNAKEGDILVGGWNFGTGSSREQAATCLKFRGIQLVIAGSFSQTYKRNAFNNGYVCLECPELVTWLKEEYSESTDLTIYTGINTVIDFASSEITCGDKVFSFSPLGEVAQRLVLVGGFEQLIKGQLSNTLSMLI